MITSVVGGGVIGGGKTAFATAFATASGGVVVGTGAVKPVATLSSVAPLQVVGAAGRMEMGMWSLLAVVACVMIL